MNFPHLRRKMMCRLPGGKAIGPAVLAGLIATLLAPVVSGGLLRGVEAQTASALTGAGGSWMASDFEAQQLKDVSADDAAAKRKQIAEESAELFKMANDLKAEVDKSNKDTLSMSVVRKAAAIERLAHNVKEKMKTSMGLN
jgi:hypothetical protein